MDPSSLPHMPPNTHLEWWLTSEHTSFLPPPFGDDEPSKPPGLLKRKRAMSFPGNVPAFGSNRSDSPKRRRTDDIQPEQSVSQFGSDASLALNSTNTFSPPTSRISSSGLKRPSSPTRETPLILKRASPPVLTQNLNGLMGAPPEHVKRLGERLAIGVDFGFVPQGLQHVIEGDPDVGYQITKPTDFDFSDKRSPEELSSLWKAVKDIFLNANDCQEGIRDENAWCNDVVRPLFSLAMNMYGNGKWWFQSVQSQSIDPLYLSTIPAATPADSTRRRAIDRKTDYVLSYSHRDAKISGLYERLDVANNRIVGHTLDTFTKRTALFSGFEVKAAFGDPTEAQLQMSIWIAASLRKKMELAELAQIVYEPTAMAEPALTIVGHEHKVYYAYPRKDGVHVLGPDSTRFERLSTDSIRGIFRLLKFYGNLLRGMGWTREKTVIGAGSLGRFWRN